MIITSGVMQPDRASAIESSNLSLRSLSAALNAAHAPLNHTARLQVSTMQLRQFDANSAPLGATR